MNHCEKVRQFYQLIGREGNTESAGRIDKWLWSHGCTTPPSVVWPLWMIVLEATLLWFMVFRPFFLIPFILSSPVNSQMDFLGEYLNALAIDPSEMFTSVTIVGTACWLRIRSIPWKHWRQLWKGLDQDDAGQGFSG